MTERWVINASFTFVESGQSHMSLNVKSTEAQELAAELARLTGRSTTDVVVDALRKQLAEVRRHEQKEILVQELMEIGKRCAAHIQQPVSAVRHGDMLYDEAGLPGDR